MFIAIPLFALLYLMDKVVVDLTTTIKAIVILAHLPAHLLFPSIISMFIVICHYLSYCSQWMR